MLFRCIQEHSICLTICRGEAINPLKGNSMADFLVRFIVFAIVHSVFVARHVQIRVAQLIGDLFCGYRLAYNLLSTAMFAWVMAAWGNTQILYVVPQPLSMMLRVVQATALVLLVKCACQVGVGTFLGIDQLRGISSAPDLVTTGCYAHTRHPQYLLAILFLAANPLMSDKWLLLTLVSTLYFVIGAVIEERRMRVDFGDDYEQYRQRVPMFFPRIRKNC